ncbi:MAG: glycosyltransferase [Alcanivoracaceae bacterium]
MKPTKKNKLVFRKTVLVIASTYPRWPDDPEPAFVHTLCKHIDNEFEIHVLCPHSRGSAIAEVVDGITIHRFRYAPEPMETLIAGGGIMSNLELSPWKWLLVPCFLLGMIVALLRIIPKINPTLIHAHWIIPQGIALWIAGKFRKLPPIVLTSHGGDLLGLQNPLLLKLKSRALRIASHVTVVSNSMLGEAKRLGTDSSQLSVAPMGVNLSAFKPTDNDANSRVPGRILFVGRLVKGKGLTYLLSALPLINKQYPDAHIVVAGGGTELRHLQTQARELGLIRKVAFLGPVLHNDLPDLYREAAIFVAPFVSAEGLGLVTLEAICCGCPALVGDVPAVRDIFPVEYQEKCIVNPLDTTHLSARIVEILQQPPDIKDLRAYVISRFGWEACASRYDQIYREILRAEGGERV